MSQLSDVGLRRVYRAMRALASIGQTGGFGYPPRGRFLDPMNNEIFDFHECQRCLIYIMAAYPQLNLEGMGVKSKLTMSYKDWHAFVLQGFNGDFVLLDTRADVYRPSHYVYIDYEAKNVVVCVRGSASVADWLTDLACSVDEVGQHEGMSRATEAVHAAVYPVVLKSLLRYPDFSVLVTGHSLGAGVAQLLCLKWLSEDTVFSVDRTKLRCIGFNPPCVVSEEIHLKCVTGICHTDTRIAFYP